MGAASVEAVGAQVAANGSFAEVTPGSRVRIATPGETSFVGTLVRRSGDTLLVELSNDASRADPSNGSPGSL
jgi:hypothetical protein